MEPFIPLISEVGFPIVVTLYLLYRIESKLDMVVQSIWGFQRGLREMLGRFDTTEKSIKKTKQSTLRFSFLL